MGSAIPHGHRSAELRSLEMHRLVAERLDDELLERARVRVESWLDDDPGGVPRPIALRWRDLLERPIPEIAAMLTADEPAAHDLRQCSPFAGALSNAERWRILREVG